MIYKLAAAACVASASAYSLPGVAPVTPPRATIMVRLERGEASASIREVNMGTKWKSALFGMKLAALESLSVTDLSGERKPFPSLYEPGGAVVMLVRRMG